MSDKIIGVLCAIVIACTLGLIFKQRIEFTESCIKKCYPNYIDTRSTVECICDKTKEIR